MIALVIHTKAEHIAIFNYQAGKIGLDIGSGAGVIFLHQHHRIHLCRTLGTAVLKYRLQGVTFTQNTLDHQ